MGLSLPIDGSADIELDIKGFHSVQIAVRTRKEDENGSLKVDQFADVDPKHLDDDSVEFVAYAE